MSSQPHFLCPFNLVPKAPTIKFAKCSQPHFKLSSIMFSMSYQPHFQCTLNLIPKVFTSLTLMFPNSPQPLSQNTLTIFPKPPETCPTLFLVLGYGQAAIAGVLSMCGHTYPWPKGKPRYHTPTHPTAHFFGFSVSPAHLKDLRTALGCCKWRCHSLL